MACACNRKKRTYIRIEAKAPTKSRGGKFEAGAWKPFAASVRVLFKRQDRKKGGTNMYVKRTVIAGQVIETKKMFTARAHTKGVRRQPGTGQTPKAQHAVNERKAEEKLRWKLNANFGAGDYHVVLHYYDKEVTLEQAEADKKAFLRMLRTKYKQQGITWKYVACTETKRMTNIHHHIILPAISLQVVQEVWENVLGERQGNVSVKPLDKRGNHAKLANYLIKETRKTIERYRQSAKRYKRFSCAQGMVQPEPVYQIIAAAQWAKEPRPRKGYVLLKDDDGNVMRTGIHEVTGYPWAEYAELYIPEDKKTQK